jgi:hypothetical protein
MTDTERHARKQLDGEVLDKAVGALRLSLKLLQFCIANVDSSVKGWPTLELRELAGRLQDEHVPLLPVERELSRALLQFAEPIVYGATVAEREAKEKPGFFKRVFSK